MAITATFAADFQKWNEGLRNAQASLKSFELSTVGVKQQLQRTVSGFDGSKIIRDAQVAAAAVAQIGGAAKLTAAEQRKVNATVSEAIAKYHALGESAPKELHDLAEATKQVAAPTAAATESVGDLVAKYVTIGAAIAVAKQAFSALTDFIGSSVRSFASAEAAQTRLVTALRAQGTATPEVIGQYHQLSSAIQRTTAFSDDAADAMEALFVQVGNVGPAQMEKATTAATDLAAGLGIDLEQAATLVSKALAGNTGALGRYGVKLDEARVAAEGADYIFGQLQERFGGQAAAQLETYAGKLAQLGNAWDNVKEAVGKFVVTNEVSTAALAILSKELTHASDEAETAAPSIAQVWVAMGQSQVAAAGIALLEDYLSLVNQASRGANVFAEAVRKGTATPPPALPLPQTLPNISGAGLEEWERQNEALDKAKKAAEAARKAIKDLADQIGGEKAIADLRKLNSAWNALPEAIRQTAAAQDRAADEFAKIGPALKRVPPDLTSAVKAFNALSLATKKFSMAPVISGLKSLDGIADEVKDTLWPVYLDLLKFESDVSKIKIGDVIASAFKLDDRIETNFMNTVTDLQQRLTLVNKKGLDRQLAELQFSKAKELATIKANSQLTEEEYRKLASIVEGIYGKMAKDAIKAASFGGKFVASLKQGLAQVGTDLVGILTGVLTGDLKGDAIGKAIGATIGGAIGFALGGPFGAAAGAAIGQGIAEVFSTKAEQTARRVSREFGTHIGEEMGQAIVDRAKDLFHGDQVAAQIFSLGDIIKAAGGLNFENVEQIGARLHDVFSEVETGAFTAAQGMEVLDDAFKAYADFVTKDGTLASAQLLELIRLNDEFGTHSAAVLEFVSAQASRAADGFNKIGKNFLTLVTGFESGSEDMKMLLEGIDKAVGGIGSTGPREAPEAHIGSEERARNAQSGKAGFAPEFLNDVAEGLKKIGPIAEASFGALLAGGASFTEALTQMAPGLEQIQKALTATGQQASGFLGQILGWEKVVSANKELFEVLDGVGQSLEGLHNSGRLTQDAFASLAAITKDSIETLERQGVTAADAFAMAAPELQTIWELQKDFHFEVDDATQALLDQAEAAGVVGDEHRSVQEQMLKATQLMSDAVLLLAEHFGVDLPADMQAAADAAHDRAGDIQGDLDGIDPTIHVQYDVPQLHVPTPAGVTIPTHYGSPTGSPPPSYTGGNGGSYGPPPQYRETGGKVTSLAAYKASKISQYLAAGGSVHKAVGAIAASALLATAMPAQAMAPQARATSAAMYAATGTFVAQGTDTVPAMLTPGEYVLPTAVVQKEGLPKLDALRSGQATVVPSQAHATTAAMSTVGGGVERSARAASAYVTGGRVAAALPIIAHGSAHAASPLAPAMVAGGFVQVVRTLLASGGLVRYLADGGVTTEPVRRAVKLAAGGRVAGEGSGPLPVRLYLAAGGAAQASLAPAVATRHGDAPSSAASALYAASGSFVPKGTDTVPAMLTPGEYVLPTKVVQKEGVPALEALREGHATIVAYHAETKAAMPTSRTGDGGSVAGYATGGLVLPTTISAPLKLPTITADLEIATDAARKALASIQKQPTITVDAEADTTAAEFTLGQLPDAVPSDVTMDVSATATGLTDITRDIAAVPTERAFELIASSLGLPAITGDIDAIPAEKAFELLASSEGLPAITDGIAAIPAERSFELLASSLGLPQIVSDIHDIPEQRAFQVLASASGLREITHDVQAIPTKRDFHVLASALGLQDIVAQIDRIPTRRDMLVLVQASGIAETLAALDTIPTRRDVLVPVTAVGIPEVLAALETIPVVRAVTVPVTATGVEDVLHTLETIPRVIPLALTLPPEETVAAAANAAVNAILAALARLPSRITIDIGTGSGVPGTPGTPPGSTVPRWPEVHGSPGMSTDPTPYPSPGIYRSPTPYVPGVSTGTGSGGSFHLAQGGLVPAFYAAAGRYIPRGTDTVLAGLTPGEGVLNTRAMAVVGAPLLNQWNRQPETLSRLIETSTRLDSTSATASVAPLLAPTPVSVALPAPAAGAGTQSANTARPLHVNFHISALDGADVTRVLKSSETRNALRSLIISMLAHNESEFRTDVREKAGIV